MIENENNDKSFEQEADDKKETEEPQLVDYNQKIDELSTLLEKERQKSLRLLADYQYL